MGTRASMQLQEEEIIEIQNETGCKPNFKIYFLVISIQGLPNLSHYCQQGNKGLVLVTNSIK